MYCDITWPDGTPFACDTRGFLRRAVEEAAREGYTFQFGTEQEFYLFRNDSEGESTRIPYDNAGYMDVGPADRGENIRREICMTLEEMGIYPESSHHEEGRGQNEIDFRYCEALKSADDAMTFRNVVYAIADRNGAGADFSPKPMQDQPGNGMHINFSVKAGDSETGLEPVIAGILAHISDMTLFLNPLQESYRRLGTLMAPGYISWSRENRSTLIRVPAAFGKYERGELRSPDTMANPYLAFGLLIYAGLEGLRQGLVPPPAVNINLFRADRKALHDMERLPATLDEAAEKAAESGFIRLPEEILTAYLERTGLNKYNF